MIRAATLADAPQIADLFYKSMPSPWKKEDIESAIASPTISVWVIDKEGEIISAALLQVCLDEAEILSIATAPSERRKGSAKMLLSYILKELGTNANVFLEVRSKNEAAISFYKSLGFEIYGLRRNYYASPKDDAILMKLTNI